LSTQKQMQTQLELGGAGVETLPLFSGTAIRQAAAPSPQGAEQSRGQMSFFACRFCKDGGRIGNRYCFCSAGEQARLADRNRRK